LSRNARRIDFLKIFLYSDDYDWRRENGTAGIAVKQQKSTAAAPDQLSAQRAGLESLLIVIDFIAVSVM
jgi:hypothetical protein